MVICALALVFGILVGGLFACGNYIGALILVVLVYLIIFYLKFTSLAKLIYKHFVCVCFCLVFLVFGFSAVSVKAFLFKPYCDHQTSIVASGTIVQNGSHIVVSNLMATYYNSNENKIMHNQKIDGEYYLYFKDDYVDSINFSIGDDVVFSGSVKFNSAINTDGEINSAVLANNIYGNIYLSYSNINKTGTKTKTETFDFVKNAAKKMFDANLSQESANIAYAMVFGEKENLEGIYEDFKLSGMAHLLAVSGLHVGFFVAILTLICKLLKLKGKPRFFVIIGVLLIYAWICGFRVSVTRALIMTAALMLSLLIGRQYDSLSSLSFAAIIILLFRPLELFSLGFQLSFCAVLGIVLLAKPLARLFSKFLGERFGGLVSITTSATIGTLPILITIYSRISSLSLVANLIAVPVASAGYMSLMVFSIICAVLPFMHFLFAVPEVCFKALMYIAKITASVDRAFVEFIPDKLLILCVFLLAFSVSDFLFLSKKTKRVLAFGLLFVLLFSAGIYAF